MHNLCLQFTKNLSLTVPSNLQRIQITSVRLRYNIPKKHTNVDLPDPGRGKAFRRIVHFEDKYTIKPLSITNLGGRDPKTGRLVVKGIGGGIKHKFHQIDWKRIGPKDDSPPLLEKVIKIIKDGNRTAFVALVAGGEKMRYILATENMKPGDTIRTSSYIPRIPVRPNEGDAYPLGALPIGTRVNCVEKYPGLGGFLIHAAGCYATIVRKAPNDHIVISVPSKREFSLPAICMCTVGRLSNVEHGSTPIGSAQKNRELGNRPRSGLWQRKSGRHGRKIRKPPPVRTIESKDMDDNPTIVFTSPRPFVKTYYTQFHY